MFWSSANCALTQMSSRLRACLERGGLRRTEDRSCVCGLKQGVWVMMHPPRHYTILVEQRALELLT